jgi:hypothetical protein
VSNAALEKKYGVSVAWIGKFRREHGIITDGMRGRQKGEPIKAAERAEAKRLLMAGIDDPEVAVLSKLSRATIANIRKELGLPIIARRPGPPKKQESSNQNTSIEITKPELPVRSPGLRTATTMTIETAAAKEVAPDMTLSRAFELVMAELNQSIDDLEDCGDESDQFKAALSSYKEIVNTLHDAHPAFMGFSASAPNASIYDRAIGRAETELHLINLELQRLQTRKAALKPMLEALKANIKAEQETR